jgi:predicted exporter
MTRALQWRFYGWAALMAALLAFFLLEVRPNLALETDLLALLPKDQHDPAVDLALREFSEQAGRKTLFLIGAPDPALARKAASAFAQALRQSPAFSDVQLEVQSRLADTIAAYRPDQSVLLSMRDRERLRADPQSVFDDARRAIYTPAGLMRPVPIADDPLGLFSNFLLGQIPSLGTLTLDNGVPATDGEGKHWLLVIAETRGSPFSTDTQQQATPALEAAIAQARNDGAEVLSSGLLPHAAYAARKAHQEVTTFGTLSLVGTMLLLLFVHRSMRPVLMSASSIALGVVAALTVSHLVFGRVHLLTLVFGASLIGVAADYSTYFLTDAFRVPQRWTGPDALRQVTPGVLLGLGTALVAYAVLAATPFPALRQIATFSATGLAVACGCVLCLFPLLRPPQAPPMWRWIERALQASMPRGSAFRPMLLLALVAAIAAIGLPRLKVENDLRLMQASPKELIDGEKRVRSLMGNATESQFVLVQGADVEQLLEREEALRPKLDALQASGAIASYAALTRALPSRRTQDDNAALVAKTVYADAGLYPRILGELGFDAATIKARLDQARASLAQRLDARRWLASPAAAAYRHLWLGSAAGGFASVVTLGGIRDLHALKALTDPASGVRVVDKVGDISELLGRYQRIMLWVVALGHVAVFAFFSIRYGVAGAARVVASPAAACLATLGVFGLVGQSANLFSTFALLLVLGIGIDYAIFLREGRSSPLSSLIAVLVSAATALLAFGLLAFSGTPFIHSFGLTLAIGIFSALVVAQASALPANLPPAPSNTSRPAS